VPIARVPNFSHFPPRMSAVFGFTQLHHREDAMMRFTRSLETSAQRSRARQTPSVLESVRAISETFHLTRRRYIRLRLSRLSRTAYDIRCYLIGRLDRRHLDFLRRIVASVNGTKANSSSPVIKSRSISQPFIYKDYFIYLHAITQERRKYPAVFSRYIIGILVCDIIAAKFG